VGLRSEDLLPADVLIRSVYWDGEDFGRWQFRLQPNDESVLLSNLTAQSKGMLIDVKEGLHWYPASEACCSSFEGLVTVADMRGVCCSMGLCLGSRG